VSKRNTGLLDATGKTDRLSIRLDLASEAQIQPGKVAVLEEITRSGWISAVGRAMRMSYRRTWRMRVALSQLHAGSFRLVSEFGGVVYVTLGASLLGSRVRSSPPFMLAQSHI
jgi:hypothetical protein